MQYISSISHIYFGIVLFRKGYHEGTLDSWSRLDSKYASPSNGNEFPRFSSLYQYLDMDLVMSKCNGNLPSSDRQAKFVLFLCTPRIDLQNLMCNFSLGSLAIIWSKSILESKLRSFGENGLKAPQISDPYNRMGLIVWSNTWRQFLIFGEKR